MKKRGMPVPVENITKIERRLHSYSTVGLYGGKGMLLIAVCDDQASDRIKLSELITTYLQERHIAGKVWDYDSAENLIAATGENKGRFDIIFLDIIMDGMNGMDCARLIRQQDSSVNILFLTSSPDYVYEGYEVDATAYLVKPVDTNKLAAALDKTLARIEGIAAESITITSGTVTRRLLIKDILYVESQKNRIEMVTTRTAERISIYTTLDKFEQQYPCILWIRSHKSFIVNFLHIAQYSTDKFVLHDGTILPISRIYKEKARETFFQLLHSQ